MARCGRSNGKRSAMSDFCLLMRHRLGLMVGLAVLWGLSLAHPNFVLQLMALFALGAYLRERPPRPSHLAGAAAAVVVLISGQFGLYWLVGLPALAVVIYWAAEHLPARSPDSDPSYGIYIYAYPIQQGLVVSRSCDVRHRRLHGCVDRPRRHRRPDELAAHRATIPEASSARPAPHPIALPVRPSIVLASEAAQ